MATTWRLPVKSKTTMNICLSAELSGSIYYKIGDWIVIDELEEYRA
jgi:hypothetical protein